MSQKSNSAPNKIVGALENFIFQKFDILQLQKLTRGTICFHVYADWYQAFPKKKTFSEQKKIGGFE